MERLELNDELFKANNNLILNYVNKINKILLDDCSKEDLYVIYNEYSKIRYLFTNSKEILRSLYNLNIAIIKKYGHSTLCFIDLNGEEERGNVCYSYLPILNIVTSGINMFYKKASPIYENSLLKTDHCAYFGLLANAYYLKDYELVDAIFNNIVKPHFDNYYNQDINIQDLKEKILNKDKGKDLFYTYIGLFIKDYSLDYKL